MDFKKSLPPASVRWSALLGGAVNVGRTVHTSIASGENGAEVPRDCIVNERDAKDTKENSHSG